MSDQETLFHYDMGSPCYMHAINTASTVKCGRCWDVSRGRARADQSCPVCLGTGRQNPYLDPYLIWPELGVTSKEVSLAEFGELQPGQRLVQINGIPTVKPRDIIHDPIRHTMWNVVNVKLYGRLGAPVLQHALVAKMEIDSPQYRYITNSITDSDDLAQKLIDIRNERRF